MEISKRVVTFTHIQLLQSWKRLYSRVSQLVNLNRSLKKKNDSLRRQLIVFDARIQRQADTLRYMHECKQLKNLHKASSILEPKLDTDGTYEN